MKKKPISSNSIILTLFCQIIAPLTTIFASVILVLALLAPIFFPSTSTSALSEAQSSAISNYCATIHQTLKTIQQKDSRTRTYLGGHYETLLSKFITPLNLRLVKNNLPLSTLPENQASFATVRDSFRSNFISYQKSLDDLINFDCKNDPHEFYHRLVAVREKRRAVSEDTMKLRELLTTHLTLVQTLRNTL